MHTAILTQDPSGKWVATFRGQILSSSRSKQYVIESIEKGLSRRAVEAKVTMVQELKKTDWLVEGQSEEASIEPDRFSITERFSFLTDFAQMVGRRISASLLVTGEGGLGKSFTVVEALEALGLREKGDLAEIADAEEGDVLGVSEQRKEYVVIKGYSTAKGLFRSLWENRNRIILFDDCDSVLKDATAVNLLKSALDSYDRRIVTWNAESFGNDDLPKRFEFTGGIIFISNMPMHKVDQAVRTRAIPVDVSMTTDQKIERMHTLVASPTFMEGFETEHKVQALEFISQMRNQVNNLSLRTLISVTKVASLGGDWKRRAEYLLTVA